MCLLNGCMYPREADVHCNSTENSGKTVNFDRWRKSMNQYSPVIVHDARTQIHTYIPI